VALAHAGLSTLWYHGFGNVNPALSLLGSNTRFDSMREFPFEVLGIGALLILFLLAATSHDFWLKNLTPRVWKWLHMSVYGAYGLVVMHVALGLVQADRSPVLPGLLALGAAGLVALHVGAGVKGRPKDRPVAAGDDGWVEVCRVEDLPVSRAKTVCVARAGEGGGTERIAVYRDGDTVCAMGNVCRHQGGPLGEGKILDGCVTCPWHGYQYVPGTGMSPPPFDDRVPTYRVKISVGRVYVDPRPLAVPPWGVRVGSEVVVDAGDVGPAGGQGGKGAGEIEALVRAE
jgi:nitrite reductase/ring-hydroxylating ferredoxin subunit